MATKKRPNMPNTGNEETPPGATPRASDWSSRPGGAPPGTSAGPRHAADDSGTPSEEYGAVDSNDPVADGTLTDQDEPAPAEDVGYGGPTGGAVGGTPAGKRAVGGHTGPSARPSGSRKAHPPAEGDRKKPNK